MEKGTRCTLRHVSPLPTLDTGGDCWLPHVCHFSALIGLGTLRVDCYSNDIARISREDVSGGERLARVWARHDHWATDKLSSCNSGGFV